MSTPTPGSTQATGNTLSIIGMVCGVVAIFILPIVLGPVGIVLGIVARNKGERLSTVAIMVAAAGLVIGLVLSYVVLKNR